MSTVISVEHVSKSYRLGQIGGGTLKEDFGRWWAKLRGKPDPLLKIGQEHHARRTGEQFWALQDVSFQVKEGEVLGIIGRNGAGKSTLLKILSQVTGPTSGEIKIKGRIASLLEVGTGFHPDLTGRENIFLNGAILGMTKAEIRRKLDEIIAFSEIEEFIDTPVKRYSSGMYVRLAFAVAAHLEPEILIVDEVLAVGDVAFQQKCIGKMQDVSRSDGRTVLFVSHNMDAILRMCPNSVLLEQGRLKMFSESRRAVATYAANRPEQGSRVDLTGANREIDCRKMARYLSVQMESPTPWSIEYGEPLRLECAVEISCMLSGLEFGISLFTATGAEITSNLSSHMLDLDGTPPGSYNFRATYQNLNLIPGSYYMQLALRSNAGFEDFISKACQFEIRTSKLSSKHKTDRFGGVIVPQVEYDFRVAVDNSSPFVQSSSPT